jgi:hypothetical protein
MAFVGNIIASDMEMLMQEPNAILRQTHIFRMTYIVHISCIMYGEKRWVLFDVLFSKLDVEYTELCVSCRRAT